MVRRHPRTLSITSSSVPSFQRRPGMHCAKTGPYPIWMAYSGIFPNPSGPEASRCARTMGARFLAERNRPATSFPLSDWGCLLPQTARNVVCKTSPGLIWFWLIVSGFGRTDPVRKQDGVRESSGSRLSDQRFWSDVRTGFESDRPCFYWGNATQNQNILLSQCSTSLQGNLSCGAQ